MVLFLRLTSEYWFVNMGKRGTVITTKKKLTIRYYTAKYTCNRWRSIFHHFRDYKEAMILILSTNNSQQ